MKTDEAEAGDLFTTQDVFEIVELQMSLDKLPTVIKIYFQLKALYFVYRKHVFLGLTAAVIFLGILTLITKNHPFTLLTGVLLGVLIGLALAWEIERRDHDEE